MNSRDKLLLAIAREVSRMAWKNFRRIKDTLDGKATCSKWDEESLIVECFHLEDLDDLITEFEEEQTGIACL